MKLTDDFKEVLLKAWSVRFMLLGAVLSGAEVMLANLEGAIPEKSFAIASGLITFLAIVVRIVAQPETLPKKKGAGDA